MTYASVNGLQLYYETHGSGRPLVLLHGGLLTIGLNFGPLLEPLAASGQVIAVELQGHGHTADTSRPMTIVAPDPAYFDEFSAKNSAMVHEFPGWTDELRSLQVPTLLIFGDRDFTPLPHVVEMFELLPDAELAVLPGTTHVGVTRRPGEVLALIMPFLGAR
jgi:pimeloyl-ACP methyl ester carboxylesterase